MHWVANHTVGGSDDYGWLTCEGGDVDAARIKLFNYAWGFFEAMNRGTHIFCEEPLSLQNGATTRKLGLAAGAIFGAFVASKLEAHWHWVDQSSWKKNVLGRGQMPKGYGLHLPKAKRTKTWIREEVEKNPAFQAEMNAYRSHDFDREPDLYDAWAIKVYGVRILA